MLLGFFDSEDCQNPSAPPWCLNISPRLDDGLRILAWETAKPTNVEEKTGLWRPPDKPDPGVRGLNECFYDDGLGLCTESLGFESYCDGRVAGKDAAMKDDSNVAAGYGANDATGEERRSERARSREFPPPLSWLAGNGGWQNKCLVPEKKDGRLVIKLKTVDRPEIFAATREDGRLRLHLIKLDGLEEDVDKAEKEAEEERWEWKSGEIDGVGGAKRR